MRIFLPAIFKSVVVYFVIGVNPVHALEFEFINRGAVPLSRTEIYAVERSGNVWTRYFSDPVTIKINVEWQKPDFFPSDDILASVQIGRTSAPMAMVRDGLLAEADTAEFSLLSSLPLAIAASHASSPLNDVSLTLANAKALGITPANDPHFGEVLANHADAHISFNLKHHEQFFYDQSLPEGNKYDFTGIVMHEIAHALGFTSIVDVQAMNPGVILNPMLLDVFRFPWQLNGLSLNSSVRQTTPGYAQFNDQVLTYAAFGSGYWYFDPTRCSLPNYRCTASHWDDASGNLMTSASKGNVISIAADDVHALDRVGIDKDWRSGIPLIKVKAEFYDIGGYLPDYDKDKFSTKTEALQFTDVTPNFSVAPTHAFHISFDGHAGTGFAVFVPQESNNKISTVTFLPHDGKGNLNKQWELDAEVKDMLDIPAHFSHFYFRSKNQSYRFNFVSTFSNYGAIFDPDLGDYGGFRLSGVLNGDLDGNFSEPKPKGENKHKAADYDATITMLLLLQKPHDIQLGIANVPFSIEWKNKKPQDNILHLIDNVAFGAPSSYNNSSSYEEALKKRVNQLLGDPEPGRDIAL